MFKIFIKIFVIVSLAISQTGCLYFWDDITGTVREFDGYKYSRIGDVNINLVCEVRVFGLGTKTIKKVKYKTDGEGSYHFPWYDLLRCKSVSLYPNKKGYVPLSDLEGFAVHYYIDHNNVINEPMVIAHYRNENFVKLIGIFTSKASQYKLSWANQEFKKPDDYMRFYSVFYNGFQNSIDIARSREETELVKNLYCDTLNTAWESMSQKDRYKLTNDQNSVVQVKNEMVENWCNIRKEGYKPDNYIKQHKLKAVEPGNNYTVNINEMLYEQKQTNEENKSAGVK